MSQRTPLILPYPALCLVTDRSYTPTQHLPEKVAQAVEGGVNIVQLRENDLPAGQLLALATAIREVTQGKAMFVVNDRVDIALAVGADGVQLGEEAIPLKAARLIAGQQLLIGRSIHSIEGAREAQALGADFLVAGTIFTTVSKPKAQPTGLAMLAQISRSTSIPFLAIGGITSNNIAKVIAQGAAGAAVISAILASSNVKQAAMELKEAMTTMPSSRMVSSKINS